MNKEHLMRISDSFVWETMMTMLKLALDVAICIILLLNISNELEIILRCWWIVYQM